MILVKSQHHVELVLGVVTLVGFQPDLLPHLLPVAFDEVVLAFDSHRRDEVSPTVRECGQHVALFGRDLRPSREFVITPTPLCNGFDPLQSAVPSVRKRIHQNEVVALLAQVVVSSGVSVGVLMFGREVENVEIPLAAIDHYAAVELRRAVFAIGNCDAIADTSSLHCKQQPQAGECFPRPR